MQPPSWSGPDCLTRRNNSVWPMPERASFPPIVQSVGPFVQYTNDIYGENQLRVSASFARVFLNFLFSSPLARTFCFFALNRDAVPCSTSLLWLLFHFR